MTFLKKISLLLLLAGFPTASFPFGETKTTDVRALSLGQIRALVQSLSNPSFLSFMEYGEFGASVYNRFNMKELSTKCVYGMFPNRTIDAGFQLSAYGYEDYQLIQAQASLAKKISSRFAIGANFVYLNENSILEPENRNHLSADVGLWYRISESVEWGFMAENLLYTGNSVQSLCHTGILYRLLSNCNLLIECGFDFKNDFRFSTGIEYEIAGQFAVLGGFRNNPKTPSLGLAYKGKRWKAETVFLVHPVLGVSTAIGIGYFF